MIENTVQKDLRQMFDSLLADAIAQEKEVSLKSAGDCMETLLKSGDQVYFRKVAVKELKFLDLVVFKKDKRYICHRVMKTIRKNGRLSILTRADAHLRFDSLVGEEDFVGLVTKIRKPRETLALNSLRGKFLSYINLLVAPLYLIMKRIFPAKERPDLNQENELLILISNPNLNEDSMTVIRQLLANNLNWHYLLAMIKANGIIGLVWKNIISAGLEADVPREVLVQIGELWSWQLYQDTKMRTCLRDCLAALNGNNIKAMVIKGAHLGQEVYEDTFFRVRGDIDLLVKIEDWLRVRGTLRELGFKSWGADTDLWTLKFLDNHVTFFKDGVKVEVKCNLWLMDYPYFKSDIWSTSREIIISQEKACIPSLENTLLIACVNWVRRDYAGLIWAGDIREILTKFSASLDWQRLIKQAKDLDIDCMFYYALFYSSRLLKYEIPFGILARLKPPLVKRRLHNFFWSEKKVLLEETGNPARAKIAFEIATFLFAGKISLRPKRLAQMLGYILGIVFAPRSHLARRYCIRDNDPRLIIYYLLQPARFLMLFLNSFIKATFSR